MSTNVEMHMNTDGLWISYSDMVSNYRRTKLYIRELHGYAHACKYAGFLIPKVVFGLTAFRKKPRPASTMPSCPSNFCRGRAA